jgi:hypothetical protein
VEDRRHQPLQHQRKQATTTATTSVIVTSSMANNNSGFQLSPTHSSPSRPAGYIQSTTTSNNGPNNTSGTPETTASALILSTSPLSASVINSTPPSSSSSLSTTPDDTSAPLTSPGASSSVSTTGGGAPPIPPYSTRSAPPVPPPPITRAPSLTLMNRPLPATPGTPSSSTRSINQPVHSSPPDIPPRPQPVLPVLAMDNTPTQSPSPSPHLTITTGPSSGLMGTSTGSNGSLIPSNSGTRDSGKFNFDAARDSGNTTPNGSLTPSHSGTTVATTGSSNSGGSTPPDGGSDRGSGISLEATLSGMLKPGGGSGSLPKSKLLILFKRAAAIDAAEASGGSIGSTHSNSSEDNNSSTSETKATSTSGDAPEPVEVAMKYESTNEYTRTFPRKRAAHTRRRQQSALELPTETADLATIEKQMKILRAIRDQIQADKEEGKKLMTKLKEENAALRILVMTPPTPIPNLNPTAAPPGASAPLSPKASTAKKATFESKATTPAAPAPTPHLFDSLTILTQVNSFYHNQHTSVKMAVEAMRNSHHSKFGKFANDGKGTLTASSAAAFTSGGGPERKDGERKGTLYDMPISPLSGSLLGGGGGSSNALTPTSLTPSASGILGASGTNETKLDPNDVVAFSNMLLAAANKTTVKAEIIRFPIVKVNRIRRNTPRILELDLTTKTLTICKKMKSKSGTLGPNTSSTSTPTTPKSGTLGAKPKTPASPSGDGDDDFSDRDILVSPDTLVSAELSKTETQLELAYYISQRKEAKSLKTWKILFATKEERERFYRLLQINMLVKSKTGVVPYQPTRKALATKTGKTVNSLPVQQMASHLHMLWTLHKHGTGWKYGKAIDLEKKTHPDLVPFKDLNPTKKTKLTKLVTQVFGGIVELGFTALKKDDDGSGKRRSIGTAISKELLQLVEYLAEVIHDTWAEGRFAAKWSYSAAKSTIDKHHPSLRPYHELDQHAQERCRQKSYKILGTLVEWGYIIVKNEDVKEASDPNSNFVISPSTTAATAAIASPTSSSSSSSSTPTTRETSSSIASGPTSILSTPSPVKRGTVASR